MSQAQDFVIAFMDKLAGSGVTLNPTLRDVFANILANQVTVNTDTNQVSVTSAFTTLSQVFTFIATPADNKPASPVGYGTPAIDAAIESAATDNGLTLGAPVEPEEPEVPVDGETFILTKSVDDEVVNGTAKNDLFDATELGSLQDGDLILDNSTTDKDILNASVNSDEIKARIQNVETLNIQGEYVKTGLDLTNVSGTENLNLSTKIAGGVATVTAVNSLNAENINAKTNISTINLTSLTSGTRDEVKVDAGEALTVNLTGAAAGADVYNATVATKSTVTLATINSAGDSVTLNAAGEVTLDSNQGVAAAAATMTQNLALTLNATDDLTVTSANPAGTANLLAKEIALTGTGDIRIVSKDGADLAGTQAASGFDAPFYDGVKVTASNTGTSTVEIEVLDNTGPNDFSKVAVDTIEISGGTPKAGAAMLGATTIVLNENTSLNLADDLGAALTVHVDNGNSDTVFDSGAAVLTVSEAQATGSIVTGATAADTAGVDTLIISATADEVTDYDADENGFDEIQAMEVSAVTLSAGTYTPGTKTWDAATDVMVVQGDENIKFGVINFEAHGQVVSAANLEGNLTITDIGIAGITGDTKKAITIVGGKGNDSITSTKAALLDIQAMSGNNTISIAAALDDTKVTTGTGNDIITSSINKTVIKSGAGDDSIYAAGKDTITLGAGSDKVYLTQAATTAGTVAVTDFVKGTDALVINGGTITAGDDINLSNVANTAGVYSIGTAKEYQITLKNAGSNLTSKDMRDSIQVSGVTVANGSTNVLGDLDDSVTVAAGESATITTGAGSDTVTIGAGAASNATIKDFSVGEDKIIVEGTITADLGVNLKNVADVSGVYTIGDSVLGHSFKLEDAGSNIVTENNLTEIVQLGSKDATGTIANLTVVAASADISVTGSTFNDYVELTTVANVASYNFLLDGSVDTITLTAQDAGTVVNFNQLAGINTTVDAANKKIDLASNASKIADAKDSAVYVYSDSHLGASNVITTFEIDAKNGHTADTILDEVAAFIDTRLGVQDGEKYVVVINDTSSDFYTTDVYGTGGFSVGDFTGNAYAYYVTGDADGVQADDIQLIGTLVSTDGTTVVDKTDIA